jgi:phage tail sheath protein FI
MATLVSPGVSVTIIDESFYIPVSAPTVPLFFIATRTGKTGADGVTQAAGTYEHSVVRTITSLGQSVSTYGVPYFRTAAADAHLPAAQRRQLHGDARNEYGLLALNQFLGIGNRAFVVRANVDLTDADLTAVVISNVDSNLNANSSGSISAPVVFPGNNVVETWNVVCTNVAPVQFEVVGSVSGVASSFAVPGAPFNNGKITFTIASGTYLPGDNFVIHMSEVVVGSALGADDQAKRVAVVTALTSEILSNQEVRSEIYEYNLVLCPGYHETVSSLLTLTDSINGEAFVIADTPMTHNADDTAVWAQTPERANGTGVAYYYPHPFLRNLDGVQVVGAASGTALRTYAYSDNVGELWFAPAGVRRGLISGIDGVGYVTGTLGTPTTFVETNLNRGQLDNLYDFFKNINPITYFPGRGFIVFGQKTSAAAASALDRVNVVRLLMYIKRALRKGAFPFLFEPNDQITRDNLKAAVDGFLGDILIKRGLYDFVTLCDSSNNTPTRIDRNELWCDVALKPVKAAEFIYIPVRVLSTGAKMGAV